MNNIQGKSFLITGGSGFVGTNLQRFLISHDANITSWNSSYDLSNEDQAEYAFKSEENKFDYIIHLAAKTAAGSWPSNHRAQMFDINMRININTFKMWHKYHPEARMIAFNSSCSYPGNIEFFAERDYWNGQMHDSVETYGFTKKAMVIALQGYKQEYGLKGTTVIPATLYGPHDHFDPDKSHVVSALIRKFVEAKRQNLSTVEVWGDGTQTREIMYVDDQFKGLLTVLNYDGPVINIGSGIPTTIRELAETIKELTEFNGRIFFNTDKFVGNARKVSDITLAKNLYGWTTDIKIGATKQNLKKTIDWFIQNL